MDNIDDIHSWASPLLQNLHKRGNDKSKPIASFIARMRHRNLVKLLAKRGYFLEEI